MRRLKDLRLEVRLLADQLRGGSGGGTRYKSGAAGGRRRGNATKNGEAISEQVLFKKNSKFFYETKFLHL